MGENKALNETEKVTRVQRGEGDKVNCVSNHCQTASIKPENLSINLNYGADTLLTPFSFPQFPPFLQPCKPCARVVFGSGCDSSHISPVRSVGLSFSDKL